MGHGVGYQKVKKFKKVSIELIKLNSDNKKWTTTVTWYKATSE